MIVLMFKKAFVIMHVPCHRYMLFAVRKNVNNQEVYDCIREVVRATGANLAMSFV